MNKLKFFPLWNSWAKQSKSKWSVFRLAALIVLIITIAWGAVPGYLQGNWLWEEPPQLTNSGQLNRLLKTGITLPDWQNIAQREIRLGGHKWSAQILEKSSKQQAIVLLRPQTYYLDKPSVDWQDIQGREKWKTDSYQKLKFTSQATDKPEKKVKVTARFFRAWNSRQTFAVIQWYASGNGGHFSPANWFWQDQWAQIHRSRTAWVAVSCQIPIEPLGDIDEVKPLVESLGKNIQQNLLDVVFNISSK